MCATDHVVVWHNTIGENLASPGTFISTMVSEDRTFNSFSLPAGVGDNDDFTITNSNELCVGSSSLTAADYALTISATDGSSSVSHDITIHVVPGTSHQRIVSGYYHVVVLDNTGAIYAWGDNVGQLGQGDTAYRTSPTEIPNSSFGGGGEEIVELGHGPQNSFFITRSGKVFACGVGGSYNRMGLGTTNITTPTQITTNISSKKIVRVCCNSWSSQTLADDGSIFTVGNWRHTGIGATLSDHTLIPSSDPAASSGVLAGKLVVQIAAGADYTVLLTTEGKVYGFGESDYGQLGNSSPYNNNVFEITSLGSNILKVASSNANTNPVITQSGQVYITGHNNRGQLGLGLDPGTTSSISTFTLMSASSLGNQTPVQIEGGFEEFQVRMANGDIYGFGRNNKNQIARGSTDNVLSPTLETSSFLGTPVQIITGQWFSGVLTSLGNIYTVGAAGSGRLGNGDDTTDHTTHQLLSFTVGAVQDIETEKTPLNTTTYSMANFSISWSSYAIGAEDQMLI